MTIFYLKNLELSYKVQLNLIKIIIHVEHKQGKKRVEKQGKEVAIFSG